MTARSSIGVDVGGTRVKAGLVDADGAVLVTAQRPTPGRTAPDAVLERTLLSAIQELLADPAAKDRGVDGVGVAVAGLVDETRGTVVYAPHLPWRDVPLRDRLAARLHLPVVVDNDANAAAWAEHRFGAGRGESHLLMLTLGTGIGGAVLTEGRLQRGRHGLAGELGHVRVVPEGRVCPCGNRGCWEQYVSGTVLRREGQELVRRGGAASAALTAACGGDPDRLQGDDVTRLARQGDPASAAVLAVAGRWLGTGLAAAVATLDPGTVVIGGGLSEAGDLLLDPARAALAEQLLGRGHRPVPAVEPAALGVGAGLVGAADLARSQ